MIEPGSQIEEYYPSLHLVLDCFQEGLSEVAYVKNMECNRHRRESTKGPEITSPETLELALEIMSTYERVFRSLEWREYLSKVPSSGVGPSQKIPWVRNRYHAQSIGRQPEIVSNGTDGKISDRERNNDGDNTYKSLKTLPTISMTSGGRTGIIPPPRSFLGRPRGAQPTPSSKPEL